MAEIFFKRNQLICGAFGLLAFEAGLILINIFPTPSVTLTHIFNVDAESSLPTWFSSSQLLLVALTCLWVAKRESSRASRVVFWVLAALFGYLSADETAMIHEAVGGAAFKQLISADYIPAGWLYIYAIPAAAITLFLGWSGWKIFRSIPLASLLFFSGLILWLAVLPLEGIATAYAGKTPTALRLAEEFCEMAGTTLLWLGIMIYGVFRSESNLPLSALKS